MADNGTLWLLKWVSSVSNNNWNSEIKHERNTTSWKELNTNGFFGNQICMKQFSICSFEIFCMIFPKMEWKDWRKHTLLSSSINKTDDWNWFTIFCFILLFTFELLSHELYMSFEKYGKPIFSCFSLFMSLRYLNMSCFFKHSQLVFEDYSNSSIFK